MLVVDGSFHIAEVIIVLVAISGLKRLNLLELQSRSGDKLLGF